MRARSAWPRRAGLIYVAYCPYPSRCSRIQAYQNEVDVGPHNVEIRIHDVFVMRDPIAKPTEPVETPVYNLALRAPEAFGHAGLYPDEIVIVRTSLRRDVSAGQQT